MLYQMIITLALAFPGPVQNYQGSDGLVHPIALVTVSQKFAIQGFPSLAACRAFKDYQNFPLTLTDANGNKSTTQVSAKFDKCEVQP